MIERVARIGDRSFQLVEMQYNSGVLIRLPIHGDARAERMTVHPRIGMAGRGRRQEVGRLEEEFFINSH